MEKEIADKEYELKKKRKGSKTKAESLSATGTASGTTQPAFAVDNDAWSIPSSEEEAPKGAKAPKKGKEDDAAAAARKAARELAAEWKTQVSKATKSINALNTVATSLSNLLERCSKSDEKPQKAIMDGLEEGQRKIKVYKQRAWFGILSLQDLPKVALHILAWQA